MFASLAADKSAVVPYDRDIADNRRKYGDGLLRKAEEHLANQRQFEKETHDRLELARQKRQEEKERQDALEVSIIQCQGTQIHTEVAVAYTYGRTTPGSGEIGGRTTARQRTSSGMDERSPDGKRRRAREEGQETEET